MDPHGQPIPQDDLVSVERYLRRLYTGVFSEAGIRSHLDDYVGPTFAEQIVPLVVSSVPPGGRVLDIGSGFGSFVLSARSRGLDARGIELAEFEVAFARERLRRLRPDDDAEAVYVLGDACGFPVEPGSLDAVTMWNVLEHIADWKSVIAATARMLRPGGVAFVICPNYAAWRQEAHYLVPWYPFFPRRLASAYLRRQGKDPAYFETSIFYRTNWGVMRALAGHGFALYDLSNTIPMSLRGNLRAALQRPQDFLRFYNPMKDSVLLAARKRG